MKNKKNLLKLQPLAELESEIDLEYGGGDLIEKEIIMLKIHRLQGKETAQEEDVIKKYFLKEKQHPDPLAELESWARQLLTAQNGDDERFAAGVDCMLYHFIAKINQLRDDL